jgi:acyl carrier protein
VTPTAAEVRAYVLGQVQDHLDAVGLDAADVSDDTDLLGEGVLDSLAVLEVMAMVGDRYGIDGDWEDYDPEEILVVGPFCRYVEQQIRSAPTG